MAWLLAAAAALAPAAFAQGQPAPDAGTADWLETVGDWYTDTETGIVQLRANRTGIDAVRQDLSLVWLALDPDARAYRTVRTVGPLDLCGATAFADVSLRLAADASPEVTDIALEVRSLDGEAGTGRVAAIFLVVEKAAGTYTVLNCR